MGKVAEAEDLTSQVFFKALRGLWRFRWTGGSFSAWLYRIATNEIHSHFRRGRPTRSLDSLDSGAAVVQEAAVAEKRLEQSERFGELHRALMQLQPEDQTLVVLRYLEDKPWAEIAAVLGRRTGAVTMRGRRALDRLKTELEQRGIDHERLREETREPEDDEGRGRPVQAELAP